MPDAGASSSGPMGSMGYGVDSLFRKDPAVAASASSGGQTDSSTVSADRSGVASQAEVGRIFINGIRTGSLSPDDTHYAGQVVARRTGLSQQDAEKRVTDTYARAQATLKQAADKAKAAADDARKASAYGALWLFVSLLIGAFVASLAATCGGRRRDL
ncbi:hypothetical protein [Variovorax sp. PBL-E5]|uniref:hypothetical protein n=1 Tax=Variovorax sp. PBL-E5 TaxID=434014 RepID=UPI0013A559FC|nr:hypothetical protein [Variovorax sp. PBL-E5]